jgi:WhiB family redox-sensing transcriptional regulator
VLADIMESIALLESGPKADLNWDWQTLGRCSPYYAETGRDVWFNPGDKGPDDPYSHLPTRKLQETARRKDRDRAKEMCRVCPVRLECLTYALDNSDTYQDGDFGIWGGLDKQERTRLIHMLEAAKAA